MATQDLTSTGTPTFSAVTVGTSTLNDADVAGLANIVGDTYNCVATAPANLDSTPADHTARYMRVGNIVTVSGYITIDPTTTDTSTVFQLALPVASSLSATSDLSGTGTLGDTLTITPFQIRANTSNNTAFFVGYPIATVSINLTYVYTYTIA